MGATNSADLTGDAWTAIPYTSALLMRCISGVAMIYIGASNSPALDAVSFALAPGQQLDLSPYIASGDYIKVKALGSTAQHKASVAYISGVFATGVSVGSVNLANADFQIGAVELKDGSNDNRVAVDSSGSLTVKAAQGSATTAVISSGTSLSAAVDLGTARLSRITMPAAWDTAGLSFDVSYDGTTYSNLYNNVGTEYTVPAAASRAILVPLSDFVGIRYIKIRSGTASAAVNQTAQRTLNLSMVQ